MAVAKRPIRALNGFSDNIGIFVQGGNFAGVFEGKVVVSDHLIGNGDFSCNGHVKSNLECEADVRLLNGNDVAESFSVVGTDAIDPGMVMVIDHDNALRPSHAAYDKRVAGIVSGGGDYKPGIILGRQESRGDQATIALMGRAYCKVDATYAPITVGDLLTTSPTLGHAMKAVDPSRAFGAVIGKALRPIEDGRGMIPVLIALQ